MVQRIDRSARTSADAATVYALLIDGSTWPTWSPLDSFELDGDIRVFRTGRTVSREEVVELVPNRRFSYALLSGLPLKGYRANIDLTPVDGGTLIHWRSSFTPKVPGTGPLYRWALGKFIQRCVDGLAAHAGRNVSRPSAAPERRSP